MVLYVVGVEVDCDWEIGKRSTFRKVGGKTGVGPLELVVEPGNGCARVATGFYVSYLITKLLPLSFGAVLFLFCTIVIS